MSNFGPDAADQRRRNSQRGCKKNLLTEKVGEKRKLGAVVVQGEKNKKRAVGDRETR